MTVFIISDTHIPDRTSKLSEKFLKIVKENDLILHAGDLVTLDVLKQLEVRAKVHAIYGNMDHFEVREHLPISKIVQLGNFKIGMFHGSGPPLGLAGKIYNYFKDKPDVIIFGHSHMPYNKKIGSTLMFNPGSLSGNLTSSGGSYGLLHIEDKDIWGEIVDL